MMELENEVVSRLNEMKKLVSNMTLENKSDVKSKLDNFLDFVWDVDCDDGQYCYGIDVDDLFNYYGDDNLDKLKIAVLDYIGDLR